MVRRVRADRERQPMAIHNRHDFHAFSALRWSDFRPATFGHNERRIDEAFFFIQRAVFTKLVGNVRQNQTQNLVEAPSLKASMHSFVVRIALRQHVPLRTCVENPQYRLDRLASSTPIGNMLLRKMLPNALPLFVRQPNHSSFIADRQQSGILRMGWTGRAPALSDRASKHEEHAAMLQKTNAVSVRTIGIDMGKNTLHLIGLDQQGTIVLREKLARGRIGRRLANASPFLIGIEAGMATHYVARELLALGHDVRQVPPAYAKPFRQGHKNDFRDAHAIAEAVLRPSTRCVPVKTDNQLDLQALHRVRSRLVGQRTAVINQIRSFLLERGIAVRQGPRFLRQLLPEILAKRTDVLSPRMIGIIEDLSGDWRRLDERIERVTEEIEQLAHGSESCRQLMTVPGIGPLIASAMVAAIANGAAFAKGRDFAAWLGLVPKQMSTGDRTILGHISKRGNRYLRTLFMQGARVILLRPANWARHSFGPWLTAAAKRLHHNVLATALANKLARIAWTVLAQRRNYETRVVTEAA